jgi:hypothetical protein
MAPIWREKLENSFELMKGLQCLCEKQCIFVVSESVKQCDDLLYVTVNVFQPVLHQFDLSFVM